MSGHPVATVTNMVPFLLMPCIFMPAMVSSSTESWTTHMASFSQGYNGKSTRNEQITEKILPTGACPLLMLFDPLHCHPVEMAALAYWMRKICDQVTHMISAGESSPGGSSHSEAEIAAKHRSMSEASSPDWQRTA